MISEHVAAQAHFEESKGNRHNTSTGLALPTTSHFDVFISRMEQRDERHIERSGKRGPPVKLNWVQKTQKKRHHQQARLGFPFFLYLTELHVTRIELRLWLGPLEVHAAAAARTAGFLKFCSLAGPSDAFDCSDIKPDMVSEPLPGSGGRLLHISPTNGRSSAGLLSARSGSFHPSFHSSHRL